MARVEISSMPWGTLWDRHGEGQNGTTATLKNLDGTNATTWSAITGGTSSTASLTADASGNLPRFVEGGQYTLDVPALSITGRRVEAVSGSVESGSLFAYAATPDILISGAVTRDSNGAATSAALAWPDGATGTYTATTVSSAFPGSVDAYTVTHVLAGTTLTFTQAAVTRDSSTGAVTNRPVMTVA